MRSKPEKKPMTYEQGKKVDAEIAKLIAETMKIQAEARWYPFVATAGLFAAALAFLKLMSALG